MESQTDQADAAPQYRPWHGPHGLRAFRHRNFVLYWIGQVISFTGSWMQSIAQSWLVFKLTGSALDLGLVGAMGTVPVLLFSLPAGALADRFDKRKIVILTQTLAMIQAFGLTILTFTGVAKVWHVMVLAGFAGVVNAFDTPIRHSMTVELVGGNREDLLSAVSLGSAAFNGARVIGPAVAGVLIGIVGIGNCFLINAVSYIAALVALLMMTPMAIQMIPGEGTMASQIKEGLLHVSADVLIRDLLIMSAVAAIFGSQLGTLMPIFAGKVFHVGSGGLGALMAATGVGALLGAVLTTALGHRFRQGSLVIAGAILSAAALMAFSRTASIHAAMFWLIMTGLGSMLFMAVSNSIIQSTAPDALRGRVISVRNFVIMGLMPIGAFLSGYLADKIGAQPTVMLAGVISVLSSAYFAMKSRAIRKV
ncbi:MAG: MFS transporter [Armatimonadota bacterium]|nr:MFS transporter [bacterium]